MIEIYSVIFGSKLLGYSAYWHETLCDDALKQLEGFPFAFIRLELFQGARGIGEEERGAKPSQIWMLCWMHVPNILLTLNTLYIHISSHHHVTSHEAWNVKHEMWSVKCEAWNVKYETWSMLMWSVWSVKRKAWNMKYETWSMQLKVRYVKRDTYTLKGKVLDRSRKGF